MNDDPSPQQRRASAEERAYFARIAAANRELEKQQPPRSLQETLERMAAAAELERRLGGARTTVDDEGDLASHLAYLEYIRTITARRQGPGKPPPPRAVGEHDDPAA